MRFVFAIVVAVFTALPALAQTAEDEAKVRAVIAEWYERVSHRTADMPYVLMAPGGDRPGAGLFGSRRSQQRQPRAAGPVAQQ